MNNTSKVIILGSNDRACLAATRELGKKNINITNVYFDIKTIANSSKYVQKNIYLGNPILNVSNFITKLLDYLEKNKIDTKKLFDLGQSDEVKTMLIQNTKEAVEQGVFGAPTFIIDNELIFGQDRLNFLKLALKL